MRFGTVWQILHPDWNNSQDGVLFQGNIHVPMTRTSQKRGGFLLGSMPGEGWAPPGSTARGKPWWGQPDCTSYRIDSHLRSTRTASPLAHQEVWDEKCVTDGGGEKFIISGGKNTTIGSWNARTLRTTGKAEELTHKMGNYDRHVIELCKVRCKNMGKTPIQDNHKIYFSGIDYKDDQEVRFLMNKDFRKSVMSCQTISNRINTM